MTLRKKLPQPSKEFQDARSVERQQGIAYLYACGPRVVLEAVLEVSAGKPLDSVLRRYAKVPIATYRIMGAHILPIHERFEAAFRKLALGRR